MDGYTMQEISSATGLATARMAGPIDAEVEALRTELAKWQERVPKLAGALRERTGEVSELRAELTALAARQAASGSASDASDSRSGSSGSGIQARDALIAELEAKVNALGGKYQDAEGQLHARDLEITRLRQEASEWREKWQSVTSSLDDQADNAGQKDRELARLQRELDELLGLQESQNGRIKEQDLELTALRERAQSLDSRNENLFETTELANRQIETLGENLEHLRHELKAGKKALNDQELAAGGSAKEIEDLKGQIASRDQDIDFLHKHVEEKQTDINRLNERVTALEPLEAASAEAIAEQSQLQSRLIERETEIEALGERLVMLDGLKTSLAQAEDTVAAAEQALAQSQQETAAVDERLTGKEVDLEAQKAECRRLEECIVQAEEATIRFEVERRQLSEQQGELKKRNEHLEAQLSERSDLVVGLEQEKSAISSKTSTLEEENKRLSAALEKAQQSAAGNADHIAQVDARLERQKQLMENLEEEFAQVQEESAEALKAHQRLQKEKDVEIATLTEKLNDDSISGLKEELGQLEKVLADALEGERLAESEAKQQVDKNAQLSGELEARRTEDEQLKKSLNEKIEQLEVQLRKQTRATAEAEEAVASARTELEENQALVSRVPDEVSHENATLQSEVIKLEGMVRERTEQLNKLRWQQDMIEKQSGGDGSESKMLVVLNQQLQVAREENQRLKERQKERQNERQHAADSQPAASATGRVDDLSRIKGIGPKLVKQLRKLGVTQFDQIATLSEADLNDTSHPLNGMKGRILKDNWIAQAAKFGGGI